MSFMVEDSVMDKFLERLPGYDLDDVRAWQFFIAVAPLHTRLAEKSW
jgi:hypothetical protein